MEFEMIVVFAAHLFFMIIIYHESFVNTALESAGCIIASLFLAVFVIFQFP